VPLPWVRLDANIATHDKVLALLADPSNRRWQAGLTYVFALAWSGGQGTDGYVPRAALPIIHANDATAALLERHGLWDNGVAGGWQIHNYLARQQLSATADATRNAQRMGAIKANCIRHHGPDCGCWRIVAPDG
jgi:hypothetical protein